MGSKPATVEEYLATLTDEQRAVMEQIRATIQTAAPRAHDVISYAIPAFKLDGHTLLWFAAWKHHYSIYPITPAMLRDHAAELEAYETSKGTIRLPAAEPIPYAFIRRLVKTRAKEIRDTGR